MRHGGKGLIFLSRFQNRAELPLQAVFCVISVLNYPLSRFLSDGCRLHKSRWRAFFQGPWESPALSVRKFLRGERVARRQLATTGGSFLGAALPAGTEGTFSSHPGVSNTQPCAWYRGNIQEMFSSGNGYMGRFCGPVGAKIGRVPLFVKSTKWLTPSDSTSAEYKNTCSF